MKHSHKWIGAAVASLGERVNRRVATRVLEDCGRNCITRSMLQRARRCKAQARTTDEFLDKLAGIWSHLERKGERLYVTYPRCYCPIVKGYKGKMPAAWCNCSQGWIKELFETSLGRPVKVKLEASIVRGDRGCRFRVYV